jgi:hypothetical protein
MKYRYIGILNLFIIVFYLVRPSMPYIEYIIHKDYIEKNLCVQKDNPSNTCHGKCYLHERLKKQSEPVDADKSDRKLIPENKLDDHIKASSDIPCLFGREAHTFYCYLINNTIAFSTDIFVPPRF